MQEEKLKGKEFECKNIAVFIAKLYKFEFKNSTYINNESIYFIRKSYKVLDYNA